MNSKEPFILVFSTSNYDKMLKFFSDLGFSIDGRHGQLCPLFNTGRGAYVQRGDLNFNLEESTHGQQKASFSLMLWDYSDEEIARAKSLGYEYKYGAGIYGEHHSFKTPDGGTLVIGP